MIRRGDPVELIRGARVIGILSATFPDDQVIVDTRHGAIRTTFGYIEGWIPKPGDLVYTMLGDDDIRGVLGSVDHDRWEIRGNIFSRDSEMASRMLPCVDMDFIVGDAVEFTTEHPARMRVYGRIVEVEDDHHPGLILQVVDSDGEYWRWDPSQLYPWSPRVGDMVRSGDVVEQFRGQLGRRDDWWIVGDREFHVSSILAKYLLPDVDVSIPPPKPKPKPKPMKVDVGNGHKAYMIDPRYDDSAPVILKNDWHVLPIPQEPAPVTCLLCFKSEREHRYGSDHQFAKTKQEAWWYATDPGQLFYMVPEERLLEVQRALLVHVGLAGGFAIQEGKGEHCDCWKFRVGTSEFGRYSNSMIIAPIGLAQHVTPWCATHPVSEEREPRGSVRRPAAMPASDFWQAIWVDTRVKIHEAADRSLPHWQKYEKEKQAEMDSDLCRVIRIAAQGCWSPLPTPDPRGDWPGEE